MILTKSTLYKNMSFTRRNVYGCVIVVFLCVSECIRELFLTVWSRLTKEKRRKETPAGIKPSTETLVVCILYLNTIFCNVSLLWSLRQMSLVDIMPAYNLQMLLNSEFKCLSHRMLVESVQNLKLTVANVECWTPVILVGPYLKFLCTYMKALLLALCAKQHTASRTTSLLLICVSIFT